MNKPDEESWSILRLIEWTARYLEGKGSESPRLDAEVLLADVRKCSRIVRTRPEVSSYPPHPMWICRSGWNAGDSSSRRSHVLGLESTANRLLEYCSKVSPRILKVSARRYGQVAQLVRASD